MVKTSRTLRLSIALHSISSLNPPASTSVCQEPITTRWHEAGNHGVTALPSWWDELLKSNNNTNSHGASSDAMHCSRSFSHIHSFNSQKYCMEIFFIYLSLSQFLQKKELGMESLNNWPPSMQPANCRAGIWVGAGSGPCSWIHGACHAQHPSSQQGRLQNLEVLKSS